MTNHKTLENAYKLIFLSVLGQILGYKRLQIAQYFQMSALGAAIIPNGHRHLGVCIHKFAFSTYCIEGS